MALQQLMFVSVHSKTPDGVSRQTIKVRFMSSIRQRPRPRWLHPVEGPPTAPAVLPGKTSNSKKPATSAGAAMSTSRCDHLSTSGQRKQVASTNERSVTNCSFLFGASRSSQLIIVMMTGGLLHPRGTGRSPSWCGTKMDRRSCLFSAPITAISCTRWTVTAWAHPEKSPARALARS